ncbi:hypothetical protein SLS60_012104 [Paraconiothyrium brasiliense]|uniref:Uncharacterized protein n=1 Tax=Paraconiothyrium brasiliense TaxID=300254 RepID=A0ABR3QGK8_9PLEO
MVSHGLWSAYNKKLGAISLKVDQIRDTMEHIDYTSDDSNIRFDLAIYKDIESVRDKYWAIRRSLRHVCQDLLDCKPVSGELLSLSESPQPINWSEDFLIIQDEEELHEDLLYNRSVRDYFSDEDESHGHSPDTESVRDNSGDEEESHSDWISRAFSSLHIGRPFKSLPSSPRESKTTNSSASGIWKSKEQIGPKNLERIRTCLLQITKYAERGQLYAIDCEFYPPGLPYAPIPSEIVVVDVVSVETTKPKREHVEFDYRLTAKDFQRC